MKTVAARIFLGFFVTMVTAAPAYAETYQLALTQAENSALTNSKMIKANQELQTAAVEGAKSTEASLFPKLSVFGNYYYQTDVPKLALPVPGSPSFTFGDYNNYTYGATLTYTLFDGGATNANWQSNKSLAQARKSTLALTERQILLSTRQAYFKVQLAIENMTLTARSLLLSKSRYQDNSNRFKAGSVSRLDFVNAKRELIDYEVKLKQSQNELAASLRDLVNEIGDSQETDYSRPWPGELDLRASLDLSPPTVFLKFDPLESEVNKNVDALAGPTGAHPQAQTLSENAHAEQLAAKAASRNQWPKIQLGATAEYMFPNGPIIQEVQQNIFSANVTLPIFEAGQSRHQSAQHASEELNFEYQRQQTLLDLERDWRKGKDLLDNLRAQEKLSRDNADQALTVSELTYQSYKAGKQQYLDVEAANLKSLEAQVDLAQVRANILNTIAQLQYLSTDEKGRP